MLTLGNIEFEVATAVFGGHFSDGAMNQRMQVGETPTLVWSLEVETMDGKMETADGGNEPVAPQLYFNDGFSLPITSYKEIAGRTVQWDSSVNEKGENAGFLYVFGDEEVTSGKIEFLQFDGNTFSIRWSGTANVFWNEEYGANVPFLFEGEADFAGITAYCDELLDENELMRVLKEYTDVEGFECVSERNYMRKGGPSTEWNFRLRG